MTGHDPTALSKAISHALRHDPWHYGLEPDAAGWVMIDDLVDALEPEFSGLEREDVVILVRASQKARHELDRERIRARYGHSWPTPIAHSPATPPTRLWHGTTLAAWQTIQEDGLLPMDRQYVHLSADRDTAQVVAARRRPPHVLLVVDGPGAHAGGVAFYRATEATWLSDRIPPRFVQREVSR